MSDWFVNVDIHEVIGAVLDTGLMLGWSLVFSILLGIPLGIILFLYSSQMKDNPKFYAVMAGIVNVLRSFPFIILLVVMVPLTESIVGKSWGVAGMIPPLIVSATPFLARLVESALKEVDKGIIEAAQAMGATTKQIIFHALLPEALPAIIAATTVTAIAVVSYTAMADVVAGGGLGALAVQYGYQRNQQDVMVVTVFLLVVLVQVLQVVGDKLVLHFSKNK